MNLHVSEGLLQCFAMPKSDPIIIKSGPVSVKLYQTVNRGFPSFVLNWQTPTGRKGKTFRDLNEAKAEAKKIAEDIASGQHARIDVSVSDVQIFTHAKRSLRDTGMTVAMAAEEVRLALEQLKGQGTIRQAVEFFVKNGVRTGHSITVTDAVAKYLEEKDKEVARRELSTAYAANLTTRLKRFAKAFKINIHDVRKEAIKEWLDTADLGPRNFNNYLGAISSLFSWARGQGYLPENDKTQAELVQRRAKARGDAKKPVWTTTELQSLLDAATDKPDLKRFFLLAAATGARTDELLRQRWENFNWAETTLNFPSSITKTDSERTSPIQAQLATILKKSASPAGEVFPHFRDSKHLTNILAVFLPANDLKWKHNGFRHTSISAKIVIGQEITRIAEEHGTSPAMIKKNYKKLMTKAEAEAWLNFVPAGAAKPKIVPFKKGKKAA